jgi:glycosyltransferase involved in cell wall biosynthesis
MRIGIDARMYGKIAKGIGRYIAEMIKYLEKVDDKNDYFIFLGPKNFDEYTPSNPRFKKVLAPWHWYGLKEQLFFPRLLNSYELDLVHFPHFNVPYFYHRPYVVTIHDLILWFDTQKRATTLGPLKYALKKFAYKFILKNALKRAKNVIVPSNYTKQDLTKIFSWSENKITVVYEGLGVANSRCSSDDKETKIRYNITKPYLIYVGSAYPHKNLEFLIRNWKKISEKYAYQLLLAVEKDFFREQLEKLVLELGLEKEVLFTGFVMPDDLACLYAHAEAFIFPSRYEGFGLPPLEALRQHCPVLALNRTCVPEVLQDKAVYFEETEESLWQALNQIDVAREKLNDIDSWLQRYSWEKMAVDILNIYQK